VTEKIEILLQELENLEYKIKDLFKKINTSFIYPLDILANTVLDRSLHIIFGFTKLIRDENFIAASHIVRCHLDNILRFYAATLVNDPQDFAYQIMKGVQVDKLKDKEGNYLKDSLLRNKLNKNYPWVTNVYKETSGFIHLSSKHVFTSSKLIDNKKRIIEFSLSKKDNYVTDVSRSEAIRCMIEITNVLCHFIEDWIMTKNVSLNKNK
jgi:hypothetical protein